MMNFEIYFEKQLKRIEEFEGFTPDDSTYLEARSVFRPAMSMPLDVCKNVFGRSYSQATFVDKTEDWGEDEFDGDEAYVSCPDIGLVNLGNHSGGTPTMITPRSLPGLTVDLKITVKHDGTVEVTSDEWPLRERQLKQRRWLFRRSRGEYYQSRVKEAMNNPLLTHDTRDYITQAQDAAQLLSLRVVSDAYEGQTVPFVSLKGSRALDDTGLTRKRDRPVIPPNDLVIVPHRAGYSHHYKRSVWFKNPDIPHVDPKRRPPVLTNSLPVMSVVSWLRDVAVNRCGLDLLPDQGDYPYVRGWFTIDERPIQMSIWMVTDLVGIAVAIPNSKGSGVFRFHNVNSPRRGLVSRISKVPVTPYIWPLTHEGVYGDWDVQACPSRTKWLLDGSPVPLVNLAKRFEYPLQKQVIEAIMREERKVFVLEASV